MDHVKSLVKMANSDEKVIFATNFESSSVPGVLQWFCKPSNYECKAVAGKGIRLYSDAKTDFWQKTYYEPLLVADNGHLLYHTATQDKVVLETSFDMAASQQFDQAGLVVRLDSDHWIKTGLEYVDGICRLSCVVTNVYSDWSCQAWPSSSLSLRVWKIGESYVIENKSATADTWDFFRIAHLDHQGASDKEVKMGLFAAAPTDAGMNTVFKYMTLKETKGYDHHY